MRADNGYAEWAGTACHDNIAIAKIHASSVQRANCDTL